MGLFLFNPSGSPVSLPYPFRGILKPRQRIGFGLSLAEFVATIGDEASLGPLKLFETSDVSSTPTGFEARFPQTIHFNVGKIGTPAVAPTPGTPDPNALSVFGQLNIRDKARIAVSHLHLIQDGMSGTATVELYRRRNGVFTLLGSVTQSSGAGDFSVNPIVPATSELRNLEPNDYLYAQLTSATLLGGASGGDGLTVDVHFTGELEGV